MKSKLIECLAGLMVLGGLLVSNKTLVRPYTSTSFWSSTSFVNSFAAVSQQLRNCQVLILNNEYNFHYEILESILALYPISEHSSIPCDHSSLEFTIVIPQGRVKFQIEKSISWEAYANATIMSKNYYSYVTEGQARRLVRVIRAPRQNFVPAAADYTIKASCYCSSTSPSTDEDIDWLRNSTTHFCVFHEACDERVNSNQAMWLNPHHKRHFLPTILPRFDDHRQQHGSGNEKNNNRTTHQLCVIGSPDRRDYGLVANYLHQQQYDNADDNHVVFHNFGWGRMPEIMSNHMHRVQQHTIADFLEYQRMIAHTCHGILSLLTPDTHPEYFETGNKKLSGSIVQAAAYQIPIVLHEDLAKLYQDYIPNVEMHGTDQESFNDAVQRLIKRLDQGEADGPTVRGDQLAYQANTSRGATEWRKQKPAFTKSAAKLPDCQVRISNLGHDYHYEVLESIFALYPLPKTSTCNHAMLHVTMSIDYGLLKPFHQERCDAWYDYATTQMRKIEYNPAKQETRILKRVERTARQGARTACEAAGDSDPMGFHQHIRSSCYCSCEADLQWLHADESHFCVFHEKCDAAANSTRSLWLNPKFEPSFLFPSRLPQFETPRAVDPTKHHLCIVGEVKRREYNLLAHYLSNVTATTMAARSIEDRMQFHHLGMGNLPKVMSNFANFIDRQFIPGYYEYQKQVYEKCDAILSLVTRARHPEYFEGPMKLSGGIVQAAAYKRPIVLHQDLYEFYMPYLVGAETHQDDPDTWAAAFHRLLVRLDDEKAAVVISA